MSQNKKKPEPGMNGIAALMLKNVSGSHAADKTVGSREKEIKKVEGEEVFILDGEDIPLLRLRQLYSLGAGEKQKEACIIIVEQGITRLGLAVDAVVDEKESIVKPLENASALGNMFSGATVLGDGSVVLIPDVSGMMRR